MAELALNSEIAAILNASGLSYANKALVLADAFKIAAPIAQQQASMAAGGEFLTILLELLKILLPILLELFAGS